MTWHKKTTTMGTCQINDVIKMVVV